MFYLLGSIVLSSYLTLSFKVIEQYKIPRFQVIVFNYAACSLTAFVMSEGHIGSITWHQPWLTWAILIGLLFIILLNIVGTTAQKINVAVASVSNKLSMVIPFVFSIILYQEKTTWLKIAGVVVALAGVVMTSWPEKKNADNKSTLAPCLKVVLPALLFVGSGLLDTIMKYVQKNFLNDHTQNLYLIILFLTAASVGLMALPIYLRIKKEPLDPRSMAAGVFIGIPNYFSIWFLIRVLKDFNNNSTAIIPINNMGIVLCSTLVAGLIFKEKLSIPNWFGIIISIGAIALIAFG
ncbi:MAG: hypothetical protein NVS9B7_02900 [Flavisolibacter sp.]